MADSKSAYTSASKKFVNKTIQNSEKAKHQYDISKKKEEIYNEDWSKQKVNINEIVDEFTPNSKGYKVGYKYVFEGNKYQVVADMVAGYLKIIDKKTRQPLKLNGKPGSKKDTHFKILKRSEM